MSVTEVSENNLTFRILNTTMLVVTSTTNIDTKTSTWKINGQSWTKSLTCLLLQHDGELLAVFLTS